MAASNEWEALYLTEAGWVIGGCRLDCGDRKSDEVPVGAVLRAYRHVTVGKLGAPSSMHIDQSQNNLISDVKKIETLLEKYGEPPFGV